VPTTPPATSDPGVGRDHPAATLVRLRLADQLDALRHAEEDVRSGEPEGVHDLRVAMRRVRSALATFRPQVDTIVTEPLRGELRWASQELGRVRDAEVVADRVEAIVAAEPAAADRAAERPVADALRLEVARGREVVADVITSRRYRTAVASLEAVVTEPPWTDKAARPARRVARSRVLKDLRRVLSRLEAAFAEPDADARAPLLHAARKAAKRLRYAAEAAAPVTGAKVRRLRKAAKRLQSVLGDHHDTVATRAALVEHSRSRGEVSTAFACGRLHAAEAIEAVRLEKRARREAGRLERLADAW
jgi:CHAD domain-containing protein